MTIKDEAGSQTPPAVGEFAVQELARVRARLAKYEDAEGNPISTIAGLVREVERLHMDYNEACADAMEVARELAALKAQPSGVVLPELLVDLQKRCLEGMDGAAVQAYGALNAIHAMIDEVARLNSSPVSAGESFCEYCGGNDEEPQDHCMDCTRPVSAGDDAQYPPCDYCAEPLSYHPWHGSGLINGVESRHIHACDKCRHLLPAVSAGGVDERAAFEAWVKTFNSMPAALFVDDRGRYLDDWIQCRWLGWQARAALTASAPSHGEQVREGLLEAARKADDVLTAIIRNNEPIATLERTYGKDWHEAVGKIRTALILQIAAAPSAGSQKEQGE